MTGLPRKYARMGFKKGWRLFKAQKRTRSTAAPKVKHMRRKRSGYRRIKTRRAAYAPKSNDFMGGMLKKLARPAMAVAYGYFRDGVSDAIANSKLGQNLPVTQFTDEAVMLAIKYGSDYAGVRKHWAGRMASDIVGDQEWGNIGRTLSDMRQAKKAGGSGSIAVDNLATIY